MLPFLLLLIFAQTAQDPPVASWHVKRQAYKKEIAINGLFSIGLTTLSGIYWKKGNEAYNNYHNSMTTTDAIHYWEQTQAYDRIRNVCGIGALFFIGRTIYYYAKLMDTGKRIGSLPDLDLRLTKQGKLSIGILREF